MTERRRRVEHDSVRSEGTAKAGGWVALTKARPVECVSNTMPQALFHRARLFNEVNVQKNELNQLGYSVPIPKAHLIDMNNTPG